MRKCAVLLFDPTSPAAIRLMVSSVSLTMRRVSGTVAGIAGTAVLSIPSQVDAVPAVGSTAMPLLGVIARSSRLCFLLYGQKSKVQQTKQGRRQAGRNRW